MKDSGHCVMDETLKSKEILTLTLSETISQEMDKLQVIREFTKYQLVTATKRLLVAADLVRMKAAASDNGADHD
ncbi:hypothetical protein RB195_012512 [Necator americanus]|uniref:Uncharacterized protein n=1 Tax=Necator americanus TaxID=51031 RepID=A0ABR1D993_NECAM